MAGVAVLGRGARMPLGVSTREVAAHGGDPAAAGPVGGKGEQPGVAEPIPAAAPAPHALPSTAAILKSYFSIWC